MEISNNFSLIIFYIVVVCIFILLGQLGFGFSNFILINFKNFHQVTNFYKWFFIFYTYIYIF